MPRTLVISDANVLIDMECGELLVPMFRLDYVVAVPDVLYEEELRDNHPGLARLGLRQMELAAEGVRYVEALAADPRAKGVGRNDLFALALARPRTRLPAAGRSAIRLPPTAQTTDFPFFLQVPYFFLRSDAMRSTRPFFR